MLWSVSNPARPAQLEAAVAPAPPPHPDAETRHPMKTPLLVLSALVAAPIVNTVGTYAFDKSGLYDVSAITPDTSLFQPLTHQTADHSAIHRRGCDTVPDDLGTPQMIAKGGKLFLENCTICHGRPGMAQTSLARDLNRAPPDLFRAGREPDVHETFSFVQNDIRATEKAAFGPLKTDDQLWALVAFLRVLPGISAKEFALATGVSDLSPSACLIGEERRMIPAAKAEAGRRDPDKPGRIRPVRPACRSYGWSPAPYGRSAVHPRAVDAALD